MMLRRKPQATQVRKRHNRGRFLHATQSRRFMNRQRSSPSRITVVTDELVLGATADLNVLELPGITRLRARRDGRLASRPRPLDRDAIGGGNRLFHGLYHANRPVSGRVHGHDSS